MANHTAAADHPKWMQHHFSDATQQRESAKLGMWIFLITEILFFGGLFCAYAIYRAAHPEVFLTVHHALDWKMGAINTVVLIVSSLTIALSIRSFQLNRKKEGIGLLVATFVLAGVFMVIKYFEYTHKFHLGIFPGEFYSYGGFSTVNNPHIFFSIYFVMTGLHGLHVLIGMGVIAWLVVRAAQGAYGPEYYTPVEVTGLYWHLVDLIWIFLFPLLYLIH